MRFTPKTDDELNRENLLEPGIYDFEVIKSENKISSKGNDMIALTLKVWDNDGGTKLVFDYLHEAMAHKLRHFCFAVGIGAKYEAGTLDADDCLNMRGKVELRIGQDKAKQYPPKNEVVDYVVPDDAKEASHEAGHFPGPKVGAGAKHDPLSDDDIPF